MKYLDPENQGLISSLRSVNAVNLKKTQSKANLPFEIRLGCLRQAQALILPKGARRRLWFTCFKIDKAQRHPYWTFDLPAMPLNWCEANLIIVIDNSMITLTQRTMHGRRVLGVRCSTFNYPRVFEL